MVSDKIVIKNARIHNLKNGNVAISKGKLAVITGVSGSGLSVSQITEARWEHAQN